MKIRILLSEDLKTIQDQSEIEEVYLIDGNGKRVGGVISTEKEGGKVYANLEISDSDFDRVLKGRPPNHYSFLVIE